MGIFAVPGTSKVSVDVHVKATGGIGAVDKAKMLAADEVTSNALDGLFVEVGRMSGETSTVVSGHAQIRTGHLSKIVELANE